MFLFTPVPRPRLRGRERRAGGLLSAACPIGLQKRQVGLTHGYKRSRKTRPLSDPKWFAAFFIAMCAADPGYAQQVAGATVKACEACHGPGGNSSFDLTPRLNGQRAHYIIRRMNQLAEVSGPNQLLSNAHLGKLPSKWKWQIAQYFAERPPTPSAGSAESSLGAEIYRNGIPSKQVAACRYCHGSAGQGDGPIPRLSGQHKAYLEIRLDILSGVLLPGSEVMHMAVDDITPKEVNAVTSYLAAQ